MPKMNVRKGDKVEVITGKDKGKQGEVLRAMPKDSKVIVDGAAIVKRHTKPNAMNQQGGIIEKPRPHPRLQRHARLPRLRQAYARWPRCR